MTNTDIDQLMGERLSVATSSYHLVKDGTLRRRILPDHNGDAEPTAVASFVYDSFTALVNNGHYPCLGARSALRRGSLRFGLYPALTSVRATIGLLADLWSFTREFPADHGQMATFVAAFDGPVVDSEIEFERLLWRQLQELHDLDVVEFSWDPSVNSNPEASDFSFSVAGRALFVVGLHPAASRWARRFSWPTLVFNPHDQFETLRHAGRMDRMKGTIRHRDARLQGADNPMLDDHGASSEARQYSGRVVGSDWRCPFTHQPVGSPGSSA